MQGLNSAASFDYAYIGVPSEDATRATTRTPGGAEAHNTRGHHL